MFLKHTGLRYYKKNQSGTILMVVVFIIVIMAPLGFALTKLLANSSSGIVTEVYGARAHFAAESAAEVFLANHLFPFAGTTGSCASRQGNNSLSSLVDGSTFIGTYTFQAEGLTNCQAKLYCDELDLTGVYSGKHFRILSQGECTVSNQFFSRQILIEARDN